MQVLGEQAVKQAARRVVERTRGAAARRTARALGSAQPGLVAFLVIVGRELGPAARDAVWRGFELVCEGMAATRRPPVSLERLVAAHASNQELALGVAQAHPRIAERFLTCGSALRQRALLARLAADTARQVSPGERGAVFLALKTVVDVLDASSAARQ